jgi:hypothetical protein
LSNTFGDSPNSFGDPSFLAMLQRLMQSRGRIQPRVPNQQQFVDRNRALQMMQQRAAFQPPQTGYAPAAPAGYGPQLDQMQRAQQMDQMQRAAAQMPQAASNPQQDMERQRAAQMAYMQQQQY